MSNQVTAWVDALEGRAEYNLFTPNQQKKSNFGNVEIDDSGIIELKAETCDQNRKIPDAKIVESFSGISKQVGFDGRDLDSIKVGQGQQEDFIGEEKLPIFKFPVGANAGNLCMKYLSTLTFSDPSSWEEFISKSLMIINLIPSNGPLLFMTWLSKLWKLNWSRGFA